MSSPSAVAGSGPAVCLAANALHYPTGAGHFWQFLNWALGLKALGCRVFWLELAVPDKPGFELGDLVATLRRRLARYGLADDLVLLPWTGVTDQLLPERFSAEQLRFEEAVEAAALLISMQQHLSDAVVQRFRRTALIDTDPAALQTWINRRQISIALYHSYFTIGTQVPSCPGIHWQPTSPCVATDAWPLQPTPPEGAAFTTISQWHGEWMDDGERVYRNDKRSAFEPYLQLPGLIPAPMELSLPEDLDADRERLEGLGWTVSAAPHTARSPGALQAYIRGSLAEFSCAKPIYVQRQTGWISDRTLCYLASGRPAVVQHTGPVRDLDAEAEGLLRFHTPEEALACLQRVLSDDSNQAAAARRLAEQRFEARDVLADVLARALA